MNITGTRRLREANDRSVRSRVTAFLRQGPPRTVGRSVLVLLIAMAIGPVLPSMAEGQNAAPLVAVSEFQSAGYNDVAIGADGTVHAVWQDQMPGAGGLQLYYSASSDGLHWTAPIKLSGEETQVSRVRVALDRHGRVYAFWKAKVSGTMQGPEMNVSSTMSSDHGSLRYRILDDGVWSHAVTIGREENVFGWFPAVDPQGDVHLVWSENSDPLRDSPMKWSDWANTVWRARLDGAAASPAVVLQDPATGFYALDGFVDQGGQVHFAALGNDRLLYWDGSRLSVLQEGISGSDVKNAPKLLPDASGLGHLIVHDGRSGAIVDWPASGGLPARTVFALPADAGGRIEDFQAWQTSTGEMLVTVEGKAAAGAATDLYAVVGNQDGWKAALPVTGNAARGEAVGYIDANGSTINQVSEWNVAYASAALDPAGGVALLLTNRRASVHTNTQRTVDGSASFVAAWSYPQLYFTRVGGSPVRQGDGRPPAPTRIAGDLEPARHVVSPVPDVPTGPAVPSPGIVPPAVKGLPVGEYACHYISPFVGEIPTNKVVSILEGGRYQSFDGGGGDYVLVDGASAVHWRSGPFASGGVVAEAFRSEGGKPGLRIISGASGDPSETDYCVLQ